jgi:hypothetical protein
MISSSPVENLITVRGRTASTARWRPEDLAEVLTTRLPFIQSHITAYPNR